MLHEIINYIVSLVADFWYLWIFIMMTLESSFFPFPSEVAMIPAWFLASKWEMNFTIAFLVWLLWSIAWALINYFLALKVWKPLLLKYWKYFFFNEKHYDKSVEYFQKHWIITTFLGRFIPAVRQYISFPAWVARMNLPAFCFFTWLWAWIWVLILMIIWYFVWENSELVSLYLKEALIWVLVFAVLLAIWYYFYNKKNNRYDRINSCCIFYNQNWEVLLQKRDSISKIGEDYAFFGWWVEKWETPEEWLIREIKEELDIDLTPWDYDFIWNYDRIATDWKRIQSNLYAIKTDKKASDFIDLEWDWAEFKTIEKIKKTKAYEVFNWEKWVDMILKYVNSQLWERKKYISIFIPYNDDWKIFIQYRKNISLTWEKYWFFWWWIEEWETPLEAVLRESNEETNFNLIKEDFIFLWQSKYLFEEINLRLYSNVFVVKVDKKADEIEIYEWNLKKINFSESRKYLNDCDIKTFELFEEYILKK